MRKDRSVRKISGGNLKSKIRKSKRKMTFLKTPQKKLVNEKMAFDIINAMGDGLVLIDMDGKIIFTNKAFENITGFSHDEMIGENTIDFFKKLIKPNDFERYMKIFLAALVGEIIPQVEYDLITKKGKEVFIGISSSFMTSQAGMPLAIISIFRDLTEHRRMERLQQESEAKYRSFVHNFKGIAYRGSFDWTPIFFHGDVEGITGYKEEELINGKIKWNTLIFKEDLPSIFSEEEKKLHSVKDYSFDREYRIVHKDGSIRWVHEIIQNLSDENGKPTMIQGVIFNVTEKKYLQEAYRNLVDYSLQGFAIFQNDRIIFANEALANIIGYSVKEMTQFSIEQLAQILHPEERETIMGRIKNRLNYLEEPKTYQTRLVRKDGQIRWVEVFPILINYMGKPAIQSTTIDITEKKIEERKLNIIHDMAIDLAFAPNEGRIANITVDAVKEILEFNNCCLSLIDADNREISVKAYRGFQPELENHKDPLDSKGIANWVAIHGQSLVLPDVSKDDRYVEWSPNIRSEICVPLKIREKTIGILNVESEEPNAFDANDKMLIETLAFEAAIAIEYMRKVKGSSKKAIG